MKALPIALLPCWICLLLASILIPPAERKDWRQEWLGELWHRWHALASSGQWNRRTVRQLYLAGGGCFRDAWSQFAFDEARWTGIRTQMRTPACCALFLAACLSVLGLASGCFSATRTILSPLPYAAGSRLALVSRTGRLEPVHKGIPVQLAYLWLKDSKLLEKMAVCSFADRTSSFMIGGRAFHAASVHATDNLFEVIGQPAPTPGGEPVALLSYSFWQHELNGDTGIVGQHLQHHKQSFLIAGVLPKGFWFVSSAIQIFELGNISPDDQSMLVIRFRPGIGAHQLEDELSDAAERNELPFTQTAPQVLFLTDALHTPIWLFNGALLMAALVVGLGHGSRLRCSGGRENRMRFGNLQWWLFLLTKTTLALLIVFAAGVEIFVGPGRQFSTEPLGGPALLWFYTAGCSLVLLAVIADQQARCRVCLQCLAFPVRVGCPGCLFLDWSGTELLCPHGHGVLYVPHHLSCWDVAERWIALEI